MTRAARQPNRPTRARRKPPSPDHQGNATERNTGEAAESRPTVFVVDDDRRVRESLGALLRSAGLHSESYASGTEFLKVCEPHRAGCVILDLRLRGEGDGLTVQKELRARGIRLPVIVLTAHGTIEASVHAMKTGAVDFLRKPTPPRDLLASVRAAIEADQRERMLEREHAAIRRRIDSLTPREREVMEGLFDGKASKEIAADLDISVRTVEGHRRVVLRKMRASSASELVRLVSSVSGLPPHESR